jgi:outer membrane beta-barrel protein
MSNRIVSRLRLVILTVLCTFLVPAALAAQERMERQLDLYWSQKREIRVIQKRLHLKESRWEFTPYGGIIPNDEFYIYGPVGLRVGYFIDEDFSVEIGGAYAPSGASTLGGFLEKENLLLVELPERLEWYAGATGLWSPIHGKFGIFATKLTHFDMFLSFGAGVIGTKLYNKNKEFTQRRFAVEGHVGTGFRLFILDWLAIRLEYRHFIYPADKGGVSFPAELSLGVSFFTAAPY